MIQAITLFSVAPLFHLISSLTSILFLGADCHDVVDKHWINGYPTPVSNPMTPYPLYRAQRKLWGINAMGSVVVEVESEDGSIGVGKSVILV